MFRILDLSADFILLVFHRVESVMRVMFSFLFFEKIYLPKYPIKIYVYTRLKSYNKITNGISFDILQF